MILIPLLQIGWSLPHTNLWDDLDPTPTSGMIFTPHLPGDDLDPTSTDWMVLPHTNLWDDLDPTPTSGMILTPHLPMV